MNIPRHYSILDFGAKADGIFDDCLAVQNTIDACAKAGGGKVVIPSGATVMSGPFELRSNIEFCVEEGALLLANPDESVYTKSAFRENKGEGTIWIGAENIENLSFTGKGTIDGNGVAFMGEELEDSYELKPFDIVDPRPHLLTIVAGVNIKITETTFKDSAYWSIHLAGCENVVISDLKIYNDLKIRNGDGIDLDHSKNVQIFDCIIESGDDCICFKNRREYSEFGSCQDVVISNCTMVSTSCAIKFGSENVDEIKNVVIKDCVIKDTNRGIGIQNRDEGSVSNIRVSNIVINCRLFSDVWWGKSEPIHVSAYPRDTLKHKDANFRFPKGATEGSVGPVFDIKFSDIKCVGENGIFVGGDTSEKVTGVTFDGIDMKVNKTTKHQGGLYDCRPCKGDDMIEGVTSGFYLWRATDVIIRNSVLEWGENRPDYYKNNITHIEVHNLQLIDFDSSSRRINLV